MFFFIIIYNLNKLKYILILWGAYLCYIEANTAHALCELHFH